MRPAHVEDWHVNGCWVGYRVVQDDRHVVTWIAAIDFQGRKGWGPTGAAAEASDIAQALNAGGIARERALWKAQR